MTAVTGRLNQGAPCRFDAPSRRRPGAAGFRRAFVHDQNDGRTINFSGDYPGVVTVHAALAVAAIMPLSRDAADRPTEPHLSGVCSS
jgi:hypothetical protein